MRLNNPVNNIKLVDALYGLRGIAALAVVFSHSSKKGLFLLPFLDLSGIGKIAVWLFFVLSAFTLTYQYRQSLGDGNRCIFQRYIIRRFFRVFPLYAVTLSIDFYLGSIGSEHLINSLLLKSAPNHFWTIPVEFQYYFIIPFVALIWVNLTKNGRLVFLVVLILISCLTIYVDTNLASWHYIPCFFSGSILSLLIYNAPVSVFRFKWLIGLDIIALLVVFFSVPMVLRATGLSEWIGVDYLRNQSTLFGFMFLPIVMSAIVFPCWNRILGSYVMVWLGRISFSVYLIHPIVLDFVRYCDGSGFLGAWFVFFLALAVGAFCFMFIEKPFRELGYRVSDMVG